MGNDTFPLHPEYRIISVTPVTNPIPIIEHIVQVLVDLLGNPSVRAFSLPDNGLRYPR